MPPEVLERTEHRDPRTTVRVGVHARKWRTGFTASLLVLVIFGCTGIREDELDCENAVSHLIDCCPGFTGSNINCTDEGGACDRGSIPTELTTDQSSCIRGESCDDLRSSGVCARMIQVANTVSWYATPEGPSSAAPMVCP